MEFFIRHKTVVAFVGFTLFCVISLSLKSSSFTFTFEGVLNAITMPFQRLYDGVQDGVSTLWAGFTELREVKKELMATRNKLKQYEQASENNQEIKRENERLRSLLEMKQAVGFDSIPAMIISKDPDNWFRTLVINRGRDDGIKVSMPVIAFKGGEKVIVGKISEVRGGYSKIIPIISPDIKVGVQLLNNRFPGLLYGISGKSNVCYMDYISRAAHLETGQEVVTSGQGGLFPAGLKVGTISMATPLESSAYQRAIVKPYMDYDLLEEVFVIKKETDKEMLELLGGEE